MIASQALKLLLNSKCSFRKTELLYLPYLTSNNRYCSNPANAAMSVVLSSETLDQQPRSGHPPEQLHQDNNDAVDDAESAKDAPVRPPNEKSSAAVIGAPIIGSGLGLKRNASDLSDCSVERDGGAVESGADELSVGGQTRKKRMRNHFDNKKTDEALFDSAAFIRSTGIAGPVDSVKSPIPPTYILADGLRKLKPYYFNYTAWCKGRWVGKSLVDVLNHELHPRSPHQFVHNIECGRLRVNGKQIAADYVLRDNDLIEQIVHRHESPVSDQPVKIAFETDKYLVVDKPCSIPVHACGRYRYNSVLAILKWEMGIEDVRLCHRLDRMTSGALILAKTVRASQEFEKYLRAKKVRKTYVARVEGVFPRSGLTCDKSLDNLDFKMGLNRVALDGTGKEAKTKFEFMWTDGKESVVKCYPVTGRTHQIRVHLQYLGYPITNDLLYNSLAFGPKKGKDCDFGKTDAQLVADLWEAHSSTVFMQDIVLNEDSIQRVEERIRKFKTEFLYSSKNMDAVKNSGSDNLVLGQSSIEQGLKDEPMKTNSNDINRSINDNIDRKLEIPSRNLAEFGTMSKGGKDGCGIGEQLIDGLEDSGIDIPSASESGNQDQIRTDADLKNAKSYLAENGILNHPETISQSEPAESIGTANLSTPIDPFCFDCHLVFRDPSPADLVMYLHCLSYKGPDFEFNTEMPDWGKEPEQ